MRTAVLRGREHTRLGRISAIAEGRTAIALSQGGAEKRYPHTQPNEDGAIFAASPSGLVVAVADGHSGCDAAESVLERLLEHHAAAWTARNAGDLREHWVRDAPDLLLDLNAAILERIARGAGPARTTLALGVVRPEEGFAAYLSMGDSHLFHVKEQGVKELAPNAEGDRSFLGYAGEKRESLVKRYAAGLVELTDTRAFVLTTDGLSEPGIGVADPAGACAESAAAAERAEPEVRSLETARGLAERALEAQRKQRAGDNIATSVAWLG